MGSMNNHLIVQIYISVVRLLKLVILFFQSMDGPRSGIILVAILL